MLTVAGAGEQLSVVSPTDATDPTDPPEVVDNRLPMTDIVQACT
jgi:hypothetical protein